MVLYEILRFDRVASLVGPCICIFLRSPQTKTHVVINGYILMQLNQLSVKILEEKS